MSCKSGDPYVLNVQKWVNKTFKGKTGYTVIVEDGIIGWNTIYALLHGLQISLGITATANNFGTGTVNAFNKYVQEHGEIKEQSSEITDTTRENINGVVQGALICKGYDIGGASPTGQFLTNTAAAVKRLKSDMGLSDTSTVITVNIMKALLSMDYFKSYSTSERVQNIVKMQRYLNGNYENYIGIRPCDGVVGRSTSVALIYAIQAEEGLPVGTANGNCGPTTKKCLPPIPYSGGYNKNGQTYGLSYIGKTYSTASINKFKKLASIGLYFNGYGAGDITENLSTEVIKSFQKMYALPENGNIDYTTWLSLLISCGDTDRSAKGCDCATIIDSTKMGSLLKNGYKYIGRYVSGSIIDPDGNPISKALTNQEMIILFANSMGLFPIYQGAANKASYFTIANAIKDGENAATHVKNLKIKLGTIIYFAVDFDAMDNQVTSLIIPYFKQLYATFMEKSEGKYRVGIYGTRNTCTRVCNAGYACSSFVSDMSTGYSGNLGYPIPSNWALDQFTNTKISYQGDTFEIDKDAISGRYSGMSSFLELPPSTISEAESANDPNTTFGSLIVVNRSGGTIPVYEKKQWINHELPTTGRNYEVAGDIIKQIAINEFYVVLNVTNPYNDQIHQVLYNDGKGQINTGYIQGKFLIEGISLTGADSYREANRLQLPSFQEPFACIHYNPKDDEYWKTNFGDSQEFKINRPVACYSEKGQFLGLLTKNDKVNIINTPENNNNYVAGQTMPWCKYVDSAIMSGKTVTNVFVSSGLEWTGKGTDRAWID